MVNVAEAPAAIGLAGLKLPIINPDEPVIALTDNEATPELEIVIVTGSAAVPTTEVPNKSAGELFVENTVAPCETTKTGCGGVVPVILTFSKNVGVVGSFV